MELRTGAEVAVMDRAPVPPSAGGKSLPAPVRQRPMYDERGSVQASLFDLWGRPVRSPGHLEVW